MLRLLCLCWLLLVASCEDGPSSDERQSAIQEKTLQEATSSVGMPAISHFRERRLLKEILELRDKDGLATFTYIFAEGNGKLTFFCDSIGYGIPYATQYTSPQRAQWHASHGYYVLPQADPSGLFAPTDAEGTWVMCKDLGGREVRPVYVEPRIVVSPFKLKSKELAPGDDG